MALQYPLATSLVLQVMAVWSQNIGLVLDTERQDAKWN